MVCNGQIRIIQYYIKQGKAVASSIDGSNVVGQEASLFTGVGLVGRAKVVAVDVVARVGKYMRNTPST